jgi:pimeloyl-ACP methyl ester carboxylesterase
MAWAAGLAPLCAAPGTYVHDHRLAPAGGTPDSGRPGRLRARADGRSRHSAVGDRMRTVAVRGRSLRVAVRGGIPGWPALLLCNGIGASLELLQPFVDALDPRREVVRFDMPGIGGSPAPVVPYHLWTLAPLLSGLFDQLGYQQADVLGMSWGGLAQQFAVRCPSRVRRLVLVATSPGALMVPATLARCCVCSRPGATAVMAMRPASPVNFMAAACATITRSAASCCTPRRAP